MIKDNIHSIDRFLRNMSITRIHFVDKFLFSRVRNTLDKGMFCWKVLPLFVLLVYECNV